MSRKKALLASSLTICSTSTAWVMGTDKHPVLAAEEEPLQSSSAHSGGEYVQDVVYQYLNPITAYVDGNLAAKVETKPLTYQVKKGDTLYHIGMYYGIQYDQLAVFNQLRNPDLLNVGRILNIPLTRKWIRLKFGDTVESLAKEYNTSTELILELNPSLKDPDFTYVGQLVAVPQKIELKSTPISASTQITKRKSNIRLATRSAAAPGAYVFSWPVKGWDVTSNFGWRGGRQHKGVDIICSNRESAEIYASLSGVVKAVKYDGDGYGYYVIIDHGNGWETLYGHLKAGSVRVGVGDRVETGEVIGLMGETGNARGVHLHFEIHHDGIPINPLNKLRI